MKILHISDPLGRHAELTNLPEDEDRNYFLMEKSPTLTSRTLLKLSFIS